MLHYKLMPWTSPVIRALYSEQVLLLLAGIKSTSIKIEEWIYNHIHVKEGYVYTGTNLIGVFVNIPLKLTLG